ncbi:MAG: 30S ribosomal protein S18 [Acidimicrobiales bacterium mtb01]|nr:30S ribosomal protein S18 [Actinomycetota bacterium]TEX46790.1 MAG: 30S ribosomal protein S18 [Acidimicrobiales bacterium mtb01]
MSNTKKPMRGRAPKDAGRKIKKKANILSAEKVDYIDYKDINLLQRFMSDRSKIRGQKINGTTVQQQRELANAVKNAREMALLPYTKRVASVGRGPRRGPAPEGASERAPEVVLDDQVESTEVEGTEDGEA